MPITFKSKASGDVIMLDESGKEMLSLLGKDANESKGIFNLDQLSVAISTLKRAIAADKALPLPTAMPAGSQDDPEIGVRLYQRALPLLELMERSLRDDSYVTWGV
jgi:hypothetical protein